MWTGKRWDPIVDGNERRPNTGLTDQEFVEFCGPKCPVVDLREYRDLKAQRHVRVLDPPSGSAA